MMPDTIDDAILYSTIVHAPPAAVYDGIATATGLDGWFTSGAQVEPRAGGRIRFRWHKFGGDRTSGETEGQVVEAQRPSRFVFRWHPSDDPSWMTTVAIDFDPIAEGTRIRLRESGYPNTPAALRAMLNCAAGWGEALTLWKFYIEHKLNYDDPPTATADG